MLTGTQQVQRLLERRLVKSRRLKAPVWTKQKERASQWAPSGYRRETVEACQLRGAHRLGVKYIVREQARMESESSVNGSQGTVVTHDDITDIQVQNFGKDANMLMPCKPVIRFQGIPFGPCRHLKFM